jgi:hypothetical protein
MFWWLDRPGRRRILSRFAIDRTVIQNALKQLYVEVFPDPDPDLVVKRILTLCDRRHRPRSRTGEVVSLDIVERMLATARANPTSDLCAAVGALAGIGADTATRCLHDQGGEPFSILCKSIGVSRGAFEEILAKALFMRKAGAAGPDLDERQNDVLIGVFAMMARDYTRTILRYWDWRRAASMPQPGHATAS